MTDDSYYDLLCSNHSAMQYSFERHFDDLAKISKEMALELDRDDWRQGFVDAVRGEMKLMESQTNKVIYMANFIEWLSENMPEFEPLASYKG